MSKLIEEMNKNAPEGISFKLSEKNFAGNKTDVESEQDVLICIKDTKKTGWTFDGVLSTGFSLKKLEEIADTSKSDNFQEHKKQIAEKGLRTNPSWGGGGSFPVSVYELDFAKQVPQLIEAYHNLNEQHSNIEKIKDGKQRVSTFQNDWYKSKDHKLLFPENGNNFTARLAVQTTLTVAENRYKEQEMSNSDNQEKEVNFSEAKDRIRKRLKERQNEINSGENVSGIVIADEISNMKKAGFEVGASPQAHDKVNEYIQDKFKKTSR